MPENSLNILEYITTRKKLITSFFLVFYAVGITGLLLPFTYSFFIKLFPFAILLSFTALLIFHPIAFSRKSILVFTTIFILGFAIETIGVHTKIVFGHYLYGDSLGFKLFNTPLIIGINWLLLIYITSSVTENIKVHTFLKILLASILMLLYDIVLEQVAPKLDMWSWSNNFVPLQNYFAWFFIAVYFHSIIKAFGVKTQNYLSSIILICQFLFFSILYFLLK